MRTLIRWIGAFFRYLWKTINFIRLLLINVVFFTLVALIFVAISSDEPSVTLPEKAYLQVELSGPLLDQRTQGDPFGEASRLLSGEWQSQLTLYEIVQTIRHAATDDRIQGMVLNLNELEPTSLTKLRYVAKAIEEFKAHKKPVIVYGEHYSQGQYYLASFADEVYMAPYGSVMLQGFSSYGLYYKSLLERLDIHPHIFRVGTYKSAVEPFLRDDMSVEAKEASSALLNQLWGTYLADVAENRGTTVEKISPNIDKLLADLRRANGNMAQLNVEYKLIDQRLNRPQFDERIHTRFTDSEALDFYAYHQQIQPQEGYLNHGNIGIVTIDGPIVDGLSTPTEVGGATIASLLREARNNDDIKAVVLRVNSPGGSAYASEAIRVEVDALRSSGKPVIASMSSMAASGGYWVSVSADKIIAQPTTITGSIGIFGLFLSFEDALKNIGIYSDGLGTTAFAGMSPARELTPEVNEFIQLGVEHGYQQFIDLVIHHRQLTRKQVQAAAQGRVWTGQDALKLGLIDELGDFDDAIHSAAIIAGVEHPVPTWVQPPLSTFESFMLGLQATTGIDINQIMSRSLPAPFASTAQQVVKDFNQLSTFNDPKGQYALCLNCLQF
ncbi:Protease 4 [Vibrio stylophorae]|uniref:Protease 4 n=1 Tax=Vibrio stylophorae TaxID=659351 RepID=A0ABM8ZU73_9VIBR|nr:signal peptide peptidase SppA [Vibrio stylophorae]CAH0533850.1 Protease 4 [Vibrio stylophorae]